MRVLRRRVRGWWSAGLPGQERAACARRLTVAVVVTL